MKTLADITLNDTLPNSIAKDSKVAAAGQSIDPHLNTIGGQIDLPMLYARINKLPGDILDHLATQYRVTPYRDHWNVALKRSAIIANIRNKRKRGTLSAVKKAVEALGSAVYITPWHEQTPKGTPGTFNITATYFDSATSDEEAQEDVIRAINDAKPYTRHFTLIMQNAVAGGINVCGVIRPVTVSKLYNF